MRKPLLVLLLAVCTFKATSQDTPGFSDSLFAKYSAAPAAAGSGYCIAALVRGCTLPPQLRAVRQLSSSVYILETAGTLPVAGGCISRVQPAGNTWKLSPALEQLLPDYLSAHKNFFFTVLVNDAAAFLSSSHFSGRHCTLRYASAAARTAVINCAAAYLPQLLADSRVLFADAWHAPQPEIVLGGFDRSSNGMNQAAFHLPFANGRGVVTGVKERSMDAADIDLQRRIVPSPLAAPETELHATTIATMIGGAGNSYYTGLGIARNCTFFPSSFLNLLPDSTALLQQRQVSIQNHSYGTIVQQFYGAEAAAYDAQTSSARNLLHIFSSGNRGNEAATAGTYAGLAGFANITGNFKMAKNVITVGAVDTSGAIATFSSSGPLYDGRLAPQLAALGLNGTSDAAALVSGTATVVHQVYKDSNAQAVPPAALVKAILFNTADDAGAKGIDYRSGFGAVNAYSAAAAVLQKKYESNEVQQGQVWTKNINLPAQAAGLKVTLVWTDTAAQVNNSRALVNDLDLELVEPVTGTVYRPWCLSTAPNADSLRKPAIRRRDSLNTAEQVTVELPATGTWQIRVRGTALTAARQAFSICWQWDTLNTFRFTNPLYTEDISLESGKPLLVQWKTAPADTNTTGTLFVSYNRGGSWQQLAAGIKLVRQQYRWPVKDTASTVRLRMDCAYGSFLSNELIIAPVTGVLVDYFCPDSVSLTWKKHVYAGSYRIYALGTDTGYMKPVTVVADTTVVLKRSQFGYDVYAVEPLPANGIAAARSPAVDIRTQGVNCFYTSFGAVYSNGRVELQLDMSTLRGVDSLVFEKIRGNTAGQVLARLPAIAGQLTYAATDAAPVRGVNTYRVRIVYKNGRSSYTETATIVTTGSQFVYIYPNPAASGMPLSYQLKDLSDRWQLQLVDVQGRVVYDQPVTLAGTINTARLQAGVYLYRLVGEKTGIAETGKIIITN